MYQKVKLICNDEDKATETEIEVEVDVVVKSGLINGLIE